MTSDMAVLFVGLVFLTSCGITNPRITDTWNETDRQS